MGERGGCDMQQRTSGRNRTGVGCVCDMRSNHSTTCALRESGSSQANRELEDRSVKETEPLAAAESDRVFSPLLSETEFLLLPEEAGVFSLRAAGCGNGYHREEGANRQLQ